MTRANQACAVPVLQDHVGAHAPGESVVEAGPWLEPGSLRHPGAETCAAADRAVGVAVAEVPASRPPSPLPVRNSELPPDRLDRTPPSSARC